ncbi:hypothetical protein EVAR_37143_1 [Eumeta japonica]|uniref:Uncharacterized protein n=1 Tax=Eumeta variegata TaxID=151549 RepID=A0A4C1WHR7_EUMVA|nr:hypothetical protein EVAR_37143_1 [Eumeta japonica]
MRVLKLNKFECLRVLKLKPVAMLSAISSPSIRLMSVRRSVAQQNPYLLQARRKELRSKIHERVTVMAPSPIHIGKVVESTPVGGFNTPNSLVAVTAHIFLTVCCIGVKHK